MPSPRITLVAAAPDIGARLPCRSVDPEVFYTDDQAEAARALCRRCPAQPDCLRFALAHDRNFGMWGGFDDQERRQIAARLHLPPVGHPDLANLLTNLPMPEPAPPPAVDEQPRLFGDQLAAAIDEHDRDGRSAAQVAAAVGCCVSTVTRRRADRRNNPNRVLPPPAAALPAHAVPRRPARANIRYGWRGGHAVKAGRQAHLFAAARHYLDRGDVKGTAAQFGIARNPLMEAVAIVRWAPDVAADVEAGWVQWAVAYEYAQQIRRLTEATDNAA